ncbi:MAG: CbiX/SirB N-terminal domain-containing protein [Candidatus Omnitrophica bacterium]|nr:CbiX/SirB N-terminal domain-containing protein [Candidatus Omnitrophota bacterium]
MDTIIVLAMHGMTPNDFPPDEKRELFKLRVQLGDGPFEGEKTPQQKRLEELDAKMRQWPRTEMNDPYDAAAKRLAVELKKQASLEVLVGYNEFCSPNLCEVFDVAARIAGIKKVIVITPMVTRGGNHSEEDIPTLVEAAQLKHPHVRFVYAWPFADTDIAQFLNIQVQKFQK